MFGIIYRMNKMQAWSEEGRHMFRGWFYYVTADGRLHYSVMPKSKKISYKDYFVTNAKAMKNHKFLKYKEFEKLLILFGPTK